MPDFQPGEWSYRKCPAPQVMVSENDKGTLWLVQFVDREGRCKGEVAITQGEHSKAHAQLFAAAPDLLAACQTARRAFAELNGDVSPEVWAQLYEATRTLDAAMAKASAKPAPAQQDDANRTFDSIFDLP